MPQISQRRLKNSVINAIEDLFLDQIAASKSSQQAKAFLYGILTKTERLMILKRLAAFLMITKGASYAEISDKLHISHNTISRLKTMLDNSDSIFKSNLRRIARKDKAEDLFSEIEYQIARTLPPKSRNWKKWRKSIEKKRITSKTSI